MYLGDGELFKLEVMRISTTPMALTLPTVAGLTSLPMTSPLTSETPVLYYTFAQPPPPSPGLTTGLNSAGLTSAGLNSAGLNSAGLTSAGLTSGQGLSSVVNPVVSPGVGSGVSPGVGSVSPPAGLVPDIMQLINYGDKDLGLLLSQRMELVWHGEFNRLFAQYLPHVWVLEPTFAPPSDRWRTFKDSAKVRFSCQDCGHGWTSMKGRVVFWFELNFATNTGCVMFKLYGQQCQRCKTGKFEHAMWYPEEVVKVIGNVYNRVGQIYYGFVRPPLRIDRRSGKPRNQHNAELCQACKEGLCKEEWTFS